MRCSSFVASSILKIDTLGVFFSLFGLDSPSLAVIFGITRQTTGPFFLYSLAYIDRALLLLGFLFSDLLFLA